MTRISKLKEEYTFESGYLFDKIPFVKIGTRSNILINIEALSFKHEPLSGFELTQFLKSAEPYLEKYTVYSIGRQPNMPEQYSMKEMSDDYAEIIKKKWNKPVNLMGTSTGGQILQYIAADHPDIVQKAVIISAAYRLSEKGTEIERRSAEYFEIGKYGRSLAAILDFLSYGKITKTLMKLMVFLFGRLIIGNIEYPNDFLVEVKADREMNFKERLHEITAPTLLISGEEDVGYLAADVKYMAENIPNAQLRLFPNQGHELSQNKRKEISHEIRRFLGS